MLCKQQSFINNFLQRGKYIFLNVGHWIYLLNIYVTFIYLAQLGQVNKRTKILMRLKNSDNTSRNVIHFPIHFYKENSFFLWLQFFNTPKKKNSISFQFEWKIIVRTVSPPILNRIKFHLVQNQKENYLSSRSYSIQIKRK